MVLLYHLQQRTTKENQIAALRQQLAVLKTQLPGQGVKKVVLQ